MIQPQVIQFNLAGCDIQKWKAMGRYKRQSYHQDFLGFPGGGAKTLRGPLKAPPKKSWKDP